MSPDVVRLHGVGTKFVSEHTRDDIDDGNNGVFVITVKNSNHFSVH